MFSLAHATPLLDGYAGAHIHTDASSLLFIVQVTGGDGGRVPDDTQDRNASHP